MEELSAKDNKNLEIRKDGRTFEEFQKNIKWGTDREKIAAALLKKDMTDKGHVVQVYDYGMDNTGEIITKASKVNANPDYEFVIDNKKNLIEIKVHSEKYDFMTFKEVDLKTYLKKNSIIAIVRENYWYRILPDCIDYLLKNYKPRIYHNFSHGRPSIRMEKYDIVKFENMKDCHGRSYIKKIFWSDETKEMVNKYSEDLFQKRKK